MRYLVSAAALLLTLTACGGGDDTAGTPGAPEATGSSAQPASPTASTTTTPPAPRVGLPEACLSIKGLLYAGDTPPSEEKALALLQEIKLLSGAGDDVTTKAVELLREGAAAVLDSVRYADPSDPDYSYFAAAGELNDAITAFADRCKAVGSKAFR